MGKFIELTNNNKKKILLNIDHIKRVRKKEGSTRTILFLTEGDQITVEESYDRVRELVLG